MAATFDPNLTHRRDDIRLWLGDYHTNDVAGPVANAFLQDATIDAKLAAHPFNEAAAQLATALIAKYANSPDAYDENRSLKLEWHSRLESWKTVVAEARKAAGRPSEVYRPGISVGRIASPLDDPRTQFRSN